MKYIQKKDIMFLIVGIVIGILFCFFYNQIGIKKESNEEYSMKNTINDDICISTQYGILHYPKEWQDKLFTNIKSDNNGCKILFNGKISNKKIELFDIIFSKEKVSQDNCYLVGKINNADGNAINVYMHAIEFKPDENFSDEKDDTVYAMQDEVNYVIEHLSDIQNFQASN